MSAPVLAGKSRAAKIASGGMAPLATIRRILLRRYRAAREFAERYFPAWVFRLISRRVVAHSMLEGK